MNIIVNKVTNQVEGVDSPLSPFSFPIEVPNYFNIYKTIHEDLGEVQKKDKMGRPLYFKEVYRTEIKDTVVGQEETTENTGVPVIIRVQKRDSSGQRVYLEPIYDGDTIVDYKETTSTTDSLGNATEPYIIEVQKLGKGAVPLFYKDIIEPREVEVFDHDEEVAEITERPIMIPNIVARAVSIKEDASFFSLEEVLSNKLKDILSSSSMEHILADMFLNEDDLDLTDTNHSANTGVALLELLPEGQAKTKTIELESTASSFQILEFNANEGVDIYLAGKKFVDGKLTLTTPVSSCTIKFVNTTTSPKQVKSYAIGY